MNKLTINKMCSHMYVHREGQTHSNYHPPDTPSFEDQPIGIETVVKSCTPNVCTGIHNSSILWILKSITTLYKTEGEREREGFFNY